MKEYRVIFTKNYVYWVYADDEDSAMSLAEYEFRGEMLSPIADTSYDEVEVEEMETEEI